MLPTSIYNKVCVLLLLAIGTTDLAARENNLVGQCKIENMDSLETLPTQMAQDSIEQSASESVASELLVPRRDSRQVNLDSLATAAINAMKPRTFKPEPIRSQWVAMVLPGGGQIYNRKYWKLPIIYGGFLGCAYALTWNGQMLRD